MRCQLNHRIVVTAIATICALSPCARAFAGAFQNGDFESPSEPSATFLPLNYPFSLGNTTYPVVSLPGWQSTTGSPGINNEENFLITSNFDHIPHGTQGVLFNGDGIYTTSLSQTFDTNLGQHYDVSFLLTAQTLDINSAGSSYLPAHLLLQASGAGNSQQSYLATAAPSGGVFPVLSYEYSFSAQSASTTLTFTQSDGIEISPILDNVQITAVPEPICLGLLGIAAQFMLARPRARTK